MQPDLTRLTAIRDRRKHGMPVEWGEVDWLLECLSEAYDKLGDFAMFIVGDPVGDEAVRMRYYERASSWNALSAAAALPPRRKRCETCGGEGKTDRTSEPSMGWRICLDCSGTGYTQEAK